MKNQLYNLQARGRYTVDLCGPFRAGKSRCMVDLMTKLLSQSEKDASAPSVIEPMGDSEALDRLVEEVRIEQIGQQRINNFPYVGISPEHSEKK